MTAWETTAGQGGWNLAVAGRYHNQKLAKVKRVKKVDLDFGGADGTCLLTFYFFRLFGLVVC